MNFINRAIKYVTRRKSKSILLILTFFLIGNLVIIGLGVSFASNDAKVLTRKKMRAVVTYQLDYDEISEYVSSLEDEDEINDFYNHYPKIKIDDVKSLLADNRVKTANAILTQTVYSYDESFDFVHLGNQREDDMEENSTNCWIDETGKEECNTYIEPKFIIKANYFPDMIELTDGEFTIVDGNFYSQEDIDDNNKVCVITTELAETNNVRVGDTIKINAFNPNEFKYLEGFELNDDEGVIELEVIGIYSHIAQLTPDNSNFDYASPYENPSNMILLPATSFYDSIKDTYEKVNEYYSQMYGEEIEANEEYVGDVTLLLNDPLEVDDFVDDYNDTVAQFMTLNANNEEFNKLSKPLDTLSLYANFIVTLVVVNAIVIITLVTALTLKTREFEIGVLLSIGATKLKVIGQFFIELALVAVIGFTLSIVSGSLIANRVGQIVLEYQITASEVGDDENDYFYNDDYINVWNNDYSSDVSLEDLISEYNVSVSPLIIMEIYVLGLSIVFVSVIIPSIMIMRFNPKKILMNQG